jgi:hypothetical protein
MKKTIARACLFSVLLFVALQGGCRRQQSETPAGRLTGRSDCKVFIAGPAPAIIPPDEDECIHYRYSGNTLVLAQRNAAFNCCPGEITAAITVNGHVITIRETEQEAGCSCLCLYDLEMEISGLAPGVYRIQVEEPYLGGQAPLDIIVDLEQEGEGEHCLDRDGYPWETAGH